MESQTCLEYQTTTHEDVDILTIDGKTVEIGLNKKDWAIIWAFTYYVLLVPIDMRSTKEAYV